MSLEDNNIKINLKRSSETYDVTDIIDGFVSIKIVNKEWNHNGIRMVIDGTAKLGGSGKSIGFIDSVNSSNMKSIPLVRESFEITPAGTLFCGNTEVPFGFRLKGTGGQKLIDSYHGVSISIKYVINISCEKIGSTRKILQDSQEFYLEVSSPIIPAPNISSYDLVPECLDNLDPAQVKLIPRFHIFGKFYRSNCLIEEPIEGEITILESEAPIKSIELQLARVESVTIENIPPFRESTEIQNIQIADGNVCRNFPIPIYMSLPKLFSCSSFISPLFKIEFEINLIIVFGDGHMLTENFPIQIYRRGKSSTVE